MSPNTKSPQIQRPAASVDTKPPSAVLDTPFNGVLQPTETENRGHVLEEVPLNPVEELLPSIPRPSLIRRRTIALALLGLIIPILLFIAVRIEIEKSHAQEAAISTPGTKFKQQTAPLASISKKLGGVLQANPSGAVTVNGRLQVTNSLVLQPSIATAPAITGQMYYDTTTNTLAYYNGTGFIHLQGGGSATNNIANNTYNTFVTNASRGGVGINGSPGRLLCLQLVVPAWATLLLPRTVQRLM